MAVLTIMIMVILRMWIELVTLKVLMLVVVVVM